MNSFRHSQSMEGNFDSITITARAKINLSLAILGKRDDGYHLLDSFVSFTDWGDEVCISLSESTTDIKLSLSGEFASDCGEIEYNLAYRAAALMRAEFLHGVEKGIDIHIKKNIPVGAGLGGGSSDAAAVMRGVNQLCDIQASMDTLARKGLTLGADVPSCIYSKSLRMQGIGEHVIPLAAHLPIHALLINPNATLSTQAVYHMVEIKEMDSAPFVECHVKNSREFISALARAPQHLESAAQKCMPQISDILACLEKLEGCELARLCGSGATCMGLFPDRGQRDEAAKHIRLLHPEYWSQSVTIG